MLISFHFYLANSKRLVLIGVLFFSSTNLVSQNNIKDSLILKLKSFQDFSEKNIKTKAYVNTLNELAYFYRFRNADSLKIVSKKALVISKEIKYEKGLITAMIRHGDYFSDIGKFDQAQDYYTKAKERIIPNEKPGLTIALLKSQSLNFFFNEKLKDGFDASYKAIGIAKKNSLKTIEATLRHNLGYTYWSNNLYDEAQIEYMIADSLWSAVGKEIDLAITKSNIALNALDKGDLKIADTYLNESIKTLSKTDNTLWLSRAYRVKARYFIIKGLLGEALDWNQKSDSLLKLIDNSRDKLQIIEQFAKIYFKKKELEKAGEYVLKMHSLAKELNDSRVIHQSYFYLKELEFNRGNLKKIIAN